MTTSFLVAAATVCGLGILTALVEEFIRKPPAARINKRPPSDPSGNQASANEVPANSSK